MSSFGYEYGAAVGGDAGGWGNGFAGMDAMGAAYDMGAGGDAGFLTEAGGGTQSGSKGKKVYGEKVMLSVTVKQLQDAENGDSGESIKVDGITPGYVKIVGTVESVDRHATQLVYLVNDTTGVMKVVFYLEKDDGENANKFADCKEGTFVRVIGLARAQANEERNILVFSMSVITDYNEVTNHMLESIYCHNFATKGPPPNATSVAQKSYNMGMGSAGAGRGAPITPMLGGGRQAVSMDVGNSTLKESIMEAVRKITTENEAGADVNGIFAQLQQIGSRTTPAEITTCLQKMATDGDVYTTIDDNHFAIIG